MKDVLISGFIILVSTFDVDLVENGLVLVVIPGNYDLLNDSCSVFDQILIK